MLLWSIFSFVVTGAVVRPSRTPPPQMTGLQGPIIPIAIAEEDYTLERDDDVASSSEEEVMSYDSAVVESDSDED